MTIRQTMVPLGLALFLLTFLLSGCATRTPLLKQDASPQHLVTGDRALIEFRDGRKLWVWVREVKDGHLFTAKGTDIDLATVASVKVQRYEEDEKKRLWAAAPASPLTSLESLTRLADLRLNRPAKGGWNVCMARAPASAGGLGGAVSGSFGSFGIDSFGGFSAGGLGGLGGLGGFSLGGLGGVGALAISALGVLLAFSALRRF